MEFLILEWIQSKFTIMKKETNYRKWSFKFLIYIILLNFLVAFMVYKVMMETTLIIQLEGYEKPENYNLI